MSKEILLVVDAVSNEKGVSKSIIFEALEAALAIGHMPNATMMKLRRVYALIVKPVSMKLTVAGKYWTTMLKWSQRITRSCTRTPLRINPEVEVGVYIEEPMDNVEFGRIAAQTAKQVIVQRVREAEREQVVDAYKDREGELINGIVKRIERGNVYLDLGGNAEAFVAQRHMIQGETVRPGDRLRAFLYEVKPELRGPSCLPVAPSRNF